MSANDAGFLFGHFQWPQDGVDHEIGEVTPEDFRPVRLHRPEPGATSVDVYLGRPPRSIGTTKKGKDT